MIQATDFVCPACRAQVGKPCTNQELVYAYGRSEFRTAPRFGKPHGERRRLARAKIAAQSAAAVQLDAKEQEK